MKKNSHITSAYPTLTRCATYTLLSGTLTTSISYALLMYCVISFPSVFNDNPILLVVGGLIPGTLFFPGAYIGGKIANRCSQSEPVSIEADREKDPLYTV